MWVHLRGPKQGHWQDAATGEFGDALDLLAACRYAGDKKAAYAAGLAWLGWGDRTRAPVRKSPPARRTPANDDDAAKKRAYALRLYLEAAPSLAGTPVAGYLLSRGIDLATLGRQPRALRYHADLRHRESGMTFPAMVAAISGADGTHVATHRTYLERAGGGWIKLRGMNAKLSVGDFAAGSIRIWRGASGRPLRDASPCEPVVIGEGIETCLSVALALPELRVLCAVSLGNLGSVWLPDQVRMVVLAADNDTHPAARAALQRAAERHIDAGREVRIARSLWGNDFNDMLWETP
ncbi:MAG TPA: toprim domain-containing protein [Rhodopila sp.]